MLSGTANGRIMAGDRTKSCRLPALEVAKPLGKFSRRGSLDSNWEIGNCCSRLQSEELTVSEREADSMTVLEPEVHPAVDWLSSFIPTPANSLQTPTALYNLPDFGILEAVKTKPAPNQAPAVVDKRPPPNPKKREDFYANVGEAIRVLRAEIPTLFQKDLTYSIYRDDIVFRDPKNSFQGKKDYQTIFWSLRFHGKLFFKMLYVDVLRIWESPKNPTDAGTILKMRWSVHGVPRVPWDAEGVFDGISTFKLDSNGKIFEHAVNNVILTDPPKQGNPFLAGLNLIPLPQQQRIPCPGSWFQAERNPEEMNGAQ